MSQGMVPRVWHASASNLRLRFDLFREFVWREIAGRYSGSMFGIGWALLNPLLMLAVYTLAFRRFLGMRWPGSSDSAQFALMIFCGMIIHSLFAECLLRAPGVIVGQSNLVKKVVFPLAMLPVVSVAASLFHALLSIAVLLLFVLIQHHAIPWTVLWLPLLLLPYAMILCGVAWLMASLGVYIRDIAQIGSVLSAIMMFLSPVFYPAESLHSPYRELMAFNPLTLMIEQMRAIILDGKPLDLPALLRYSAIAIVVMVAGRTWFQRTRDGFADVL